jgi:hypothetical protein
MPRNLVRDDAVIEPYREEFSLIVSNKEIDYKLSHTDVIFGDLNSSKSKISRTLGTCYGMYTSKSFIIIDSEYWKYASSMSRAFTMYHEFGHCVCNLPHTQSSNSWYRPLEEILYKLKIVEKKYDLPDGCPSSLMHPYDLSESCMLNNYMYYLEELKKACNENR